MKLQSMNCIATQIPESGSLFEQSQQVGFGSSLAKLALVVSYLHELYWCHQC
jgi:hypothetical protein